MYNFLQWHMLRNLGNTIVLDMYLGSTMVCFEVLYKYHNITKGHGNTMVYEYGDH